MNRYLRQVLGIYTYTRRCALEEFENKPRKQQGYSTVSHFNVVHYDCHTSAVSDVLVIKPNKSSRNKLSHLTCAVYNKVVNKIVCSLCSQEVLLNKARLANKLSLFSFFWLIFLLNFVLFGIELKIAALMLG